MDNEPGTDGMPEGVAASDTLVLVETLSSSYLLDLNEMTVVRRGGEGWASKAPGGFDSPPPGASVLEGDGEKIKVLALAPLCPGESWRLVLDLGRPVLRQTTPVVKVTRLSHPAADGGAPTPTT